MPANLLAALLQRQQVADGEGPRAGLGADAPAATPPPGPNAARAAPRPQPSATHDAPLVAYRHRVRLWPRIAARPGLRTPTTRSCRLPWPAIRDISPDCLACFDEESWECAKGRARGYGAPDAGRLFEIGAVDGKMPYHMTDGMTTSASGRVAPPFVIHSRPHEERAVAHPPYRPVSVRIEITQYHFEKIWPKTQNPTRHMFSSLHPFLSMSQSVYILYRFVAASVVRRNKIPSA